MRLTPEFVSKASSHLNCLKERELDFRGLQIPAIENLASHQGSYDTLNITDNSLTVLGNIPLSPRLQAIHAAQNQIISISPSIAPNIPNIVTLILTNNTISSLATLVPLESLKSLRYLSLIGNPVTELEHYREFTVWKVAEGNLHTLDFTRIKDSLRSSAQKLLTDPLTNLPNSLANQLSIPTTTSIPGASLAISQKQAGGAIAMKGGKGRLMTPDEKRRVVEALTKADTADQVRRLERMLAEGLVPDGGIEEAVVGDGDGGAAE